ncbi:MAG: hypothetical protein HYT93_02560 [Parcubacteria group bacterium]|nr:hypothetical protein [Parcubacteria group bacterium]
MITYLTAAFGLVVGLAWNDAVKAFIEFVFPIQKDSLWAKFGYAFVLTVVFVLITIYIARLFKKQ